tara:strand:+ start:394 stop:1437 length:1044 start_codon:yes stop_codon:yes gene_type:complete
MVAFKEQTYGGGGLSSLSGGQLSGQGPKSISGTGGLGMQSPGGFGATVMSYYRRKKPDGTYEYHQTGNTAQPAPSGEGWERSSQEFPGQHGDIGPGGDPFPREHIGRPRLPSFDDRGGYVDWRRDEFFKPRKDAEPWINKETGEPWKKKGRGDMPPGYKAGPTDAAEPWPDDPRLAEYEQGPTESPIDFPGGPGIFWRPDTYPPDVSEPMPPPQPPVMPLPKPPVMPLPQPPVMPPQPPVMPSPTPQPPVMPTPQPPVIPDWQRRRPGHEIQADLARARAASSVGIPPVSPTPQPQLPASTQMPTPYSPAPAPVFRPPAIQLRHGGSLTDSILNILRSLSKENSNGK